jgi:hypothetical protein
LITTIKPELNLNIFGLKSNVPGAKKLFTFEESPSGNKMFIFYYSYGELNNIMREIIFHGPNPKPKFKFTEK